MYLTLLLVMRTRSKCWKKAQQERSLKPPRVVRLPKKKKKSWWRTPPQAMMTA
jgi:hypothetical protein